MLHSDQELIRQCRVYNIYTVTVCVWCQYCTVSKIACIVGLATIYTHIVIDVVCWPFFCPLFRESLNELHYSEISLDARKIHLYNATWVRRPGLLVHCSLHTSHVLETEDTSHQSRVSQPLYSIVCDLLNIHNLVSKYNLSTRLYPGVQACCIANIVLNDWQTLLGLLSPRAKTKYCCVS